MNPGALIVGNFLSGCGLNEGVCEELARRLSPGRRVVTASNRKARLARLGDMALTAWRRREEYAVAQVDVFSGNAFFWAEAVCWTLRRAGRPYVLTLRGGNLPGFARRWPGRVRRLLNSAAIVATPSPYLLAGMQPYCDRLHLVPNPLDIPSYPFRLRSSPRPKLVWLRAFDRNYNAEMAPEVVARLLPEFGETELAMYGPDKGDGTLQRTKARAAGLGVAGRIRWPGRVPKREVPRRLDEGDIFLNTTNLDNTPVSVLEAMACGLCVVSTNVSGIPHLLQHEVDALLVPPRDPDAMTAAVRRLLLDGELAARISLNARRKAERCDWSAVLPEWERILGQAAAGGARR